jgi:predicted restriction endonuclease
MSYAEINPTINYNQSLPNSSTLSYRNSIGYATSQSSGFDSFDKNMGQFEETPQFSKFQQLHGQNDKFSENYCGGASTLAIGGMKLENNNVSLLYFSDNNMQRVQQQIKREIFRLSNESFKLEVNQDPQDLLIAMRYIFLEHSKNLPTHTVRQVKILNRQLLDYIVPDIMTNIKQHYKYLKDISEPIKPMDQPLNVNNKGRRTLPSITTLWR